MKGNMNIGVKGSICIYHRFHIRSLILPDVEIQENPIMGRTAVDLGRVRVSRVRELLYLDRYNHGDTKYKYDNK
jgi:hypothetical protein